MKNYEIAAAYGITTQAVSKWTPAKREAAKAEILAGADPIVKQLIGELAQACYVASCVQGEQILLNVSARHGSFDVTENNHVIFESALTPAGLINVTHKVQELCK